MYYKFIKIHTLSTSSPRRCKEKITSKKKGRSYKVSKSFKVNSFYDLLFVYPL